MGVDMAILRGIWDCMGVTSINLDFLESKEVLEGGGRRQVMLARGRQLVLVRRRQMDGALRIECETRMADRQLLIM